MRQAITASPTKVEWIGNIAIQVNSRSILKPRYSKEELAQCGEALYEFGIRQQVEVGNEVKIVAIAIDAD